MIQRMFIALATGLVWCGIGGFAAAQTGQLGQYNPPQWRTRSPVSPYVNLGPGGNAVDYYGIVRPQIDAQRALDQLQNNPAANVPLNNLLPMNAATTATTITGLQTGHPVSFNNYQRFFPMTAGTVSGMPGTPGYGLAGAGATGFGTPAYPMGGGYGGVGFGVGAFGTTGAGGGGRSSFFPSTMGPSQLR